MSGRRAGRAFVAFLFVLPFLVRAIYFLETRHQPYFQWNFLVAYVNHDLATDLALGRGAPYALYRSPFYPLLVSWIYRLVGIEPLAVRILQWALGGAGCLLIYRLGLTLLDRRRALVALALAGLFIPAVCYEGELLEQSLATFFVLAGVTLTSAALLRGGKLRLFSGSLLYGAGFLLRPDLLLAAPFLLIAIASGAPSGTPAGARKAARLGVFSAGCVFMGILLLKPHILINVRENDTPINAAINLHLGNNPQADGHSARFPETAELPTIDPDARRDHMTGLDLAGVRYAESQTGGDLSTVSAYWLHETLGYIASDPVGWAGLIAKKCVLFFNGYLLGTQKDWYFLRDSAAVLRALLWCAGLCFPLGLILPLAAVGACGPMETSRRMLLLAVPLGCLATTLVFFHDARFLLPSAPFLILLASSGLVSVLAATRARRWMPVVAVCLLLVFSNVDWLGTHVMSRAAEEFRVGTMYLDSGDPVMAGAAYRRSIESDPGFVPALDNLVLTTRTPDERESAAAFLRGLSVSGRDSAPLMRSLASLALLAGKPDEALDVLRRGISRFPADTALQLDLAGQLMRRGSCVEALELGRKAIAGGARESRAFAYSGFCLAARGDLEAAVSLLREGTALHPDDLTLLGLLGQTYDQLGRRDEAQKCYRDVLERDPGHAEAALQLARSLAADGRIGEALVWAKKAAQLGHPAAASLVRDLESHQPR
ncbi:MAG TPA: tetratricopeptide repeat protein [Patescibacteria group bacterium]|nr:tetratricopeptide repeat protein [Patescibacteria group bacterium]